jgi:hypothetical protein
VVSSGYPCGIFWLPLQKLGSFQFNLNTMSVGSFLLNAVEKRRNIKKRLKIP